MQDQPELRLVCSSDNRFSLEGDTEIETPYPVLTLFTVLRNDIDPRHDVMGKLGSFDYFTKSEKDCPGLRTRLEEIFRQ